MSIATKGNSENKPIIDKREQIRILREYHQETLDSIGVPDAIFIPKMAYVPHGKSELHIGFFASEINKGEDIYVEFCSRENVPEDPNRTLYRYTNNPHFAQEYDVTEPSGPSGHVRYLVPVGELKVIPHVEKGKEVKQISLEFDIDDPEDDLPIEQLTIRDLAAILLKTPCSRKEFLNKIIENLK